MQNEPQPQHPSFESMNTTNIFFMSYAGVRNYTKTGTDTLGQDEKKLNTEV